MFFLRGGGLYVTGLALLAEQNTNANEPFDSALQKQTRRCSSQASEQHRKHSEQMVEKICILLMGYSIKLTL